ncbi:hypothetical protein RCL1_003573 [Eukaryota sp. TZLM3-RCL]
MAPKAKAKPKAAPKARAASKSAPKASRPAASRTSRPATSASRKAPVVRSKAPSKPLAPVKASARSSSKPTSTISIAKTPSVGKPMLLTKKNGTVDTRSSAVRSGLVRTTKSGLIDSRCAAVKRNLLAVRVDGSPSLRSPIMKPGFTTTPRTPQITINSDHSVRRNCSAVNQGFVKIRSDGGFDNRSSLFRTNQARVTTENTLDKRYRTGQTAKVCIDPSSLTASDIRSSYAQKVYRTSRPCTTANHDVGHYTALNLASELLKHKQGPHDTECNLKQALHEVLNNPSNFRMVDSHTNRVEHRRIENELKHALGDNTVILSRAANERAFVCASRMGRIAAQLGPGSLADRIALNFQKQFEKLLSR